MGWIVDFIVIGAENGNGVLFHAAMFAMRRAHGATAIDPNMVMNAMMEVK